jgi:Ni,Fe-hydrogenase III large subunit
MNLGADQMAILANGRAINRADIPRLQTGTFQSAILDSVERGQRVIALFGIHSAADQGAELIVVMADDQQSQVRVASTELTEAHFESLTPRCPQVHLFEREIGEQFGIQARGHPSFKPVRFEKRSADEQPVVGVMDFYRVEGDPVHEVAVGPVHAGIIEPGHFRFQCHGENVFHLEISLGYQHRGVERAMVGGPNNRSVHYAETLAGDTSVGHCIAYCRTIEAFAKCQKTPRAQTLRGISLELERLANHVGDLGALAQDVGFLSTSSYCGRLRGDFLNMTALLCGSRFGRGMIRPGGVGFDVDAPRVEELLRRIRITKKDCKNAIELLWSSSSVMARFEDIGVLSQSVAQELGMVGPAARASGLVRDVRQDHPCGIFRFTQIPVSAGNAGDVFSRAFVRWLEVQRSIAFIEEQLQSLPPGPVLNPVNPLAPNQLAVSLVEGWRGEICHVALTDDRGRFQRYKIVDPSFHNWAGVAMSLRNQQISDFPLCNKSFNLSYCGHDL